MRRVGLTALLAAALALALVDRGAADPAAQLYPIDLRVDGGEDAWHSSALFRLEWERPPIADQGLPIAAVRYRIRNAAGLLVASGTRLGDRSSIEVQAPTPSGVYAAEVWLEGPGGERGPSASAALRYDYERPGAPGALTAAGWIAAGTAVVAIEAPPGPAPASGIRGYAVAVDRRGETWPCAARDACREAELDLRGSSGGDLPLGSLPEGVSVVRVVSVSGAGLPSAAAGEAVVRVDTSQPDVVLAGAPGGWASGPVRVTAAATDALSGMAPDGANGPFTAIAVDGGVPRTEAGDAVAVTVEGEGVHRVDAYARDAAGNVDRRTPASATVSIDETPPHLSFANAQDPAEPERIEATVADSLSGPASGRGSIAVREEGTSGPWEPLPTTQTQNRLVARWDSDSHPDGVYEFRATASDAAGNSASSNRRANHTRMVLVNPLKQGTRLQAGFDRRAGSAKTVRYGRRPLFGGRLTAAAGIPLANLPIRVVESFGAGATVSVRSTTVETEADGSFALRLPPGPSREVRAVFEGTRTLSRADGEQAQLAVLAGIGLRASVKTARVGGAPVVFSGRVRRLGARLPAGGAAVELQFRVAGSEWAEFRTVQTDARGRFRYPYAFSDDDSRGVRFRFRAYISGGGWPYEPAASNGVTVRGR
ncbi:MAG TPA: hypothetical protein VFY48_04250 [Solirubrobacterales bacterium]|nr:hypothetical protein [Solirubrobacterales bacterium]